MISYDLQTNIGNHKGRKYNNELLKEKRSRTPALPYYRSTVLVSF